MGASHAAVLISKLSGVEFSQNAIYNSFQRKTEILQGRFKLLRMKQMQIKMRALFNKYK